MKTPKTLADLVDLAKQRHDNASFRELERISREADRLISHTTLSALEKGSYGARVSRALRENLAWLSGEPISVVNQIVGKVSAPFELPDDADLLTGDQRAAVLATVRAFVKVNKVAESRLGKVEHLSDLDDDVVTVFDRKPQPNLLDPDDPTDSGFFSTREQRDSSAPRAAAEGHEMEDERQRTTREQEEDADRE